jgi:hypothetical protein
MIGRITEDGRIVPMSATECLVPPQRFSPWLESGKATHSKAA